MFTVFDTSVVIAALLNPKGFADQLITKSGRDFLICSSNSIIDEIKAKLLEKGFKEENIHSLIKPYVDISIICDKSRYKTSEIKNDDHIISCFRQCNADLIVTLDIGLGNSPLTVPF